MVGKSSKYVDYGTNVLKPMREAAGLSQLDMAEMLDISQSSVVRWESGASCPDAVQAWAWYEACGVNPVPYLMQWHHPERYKPGKFDRRVLRRAIDLMPIDEQALLLYAITGNHGSYWSGLLAMLGAHIHLPLKARFIHATMVRAHYQVAASVGTLANIDKPLPNMEMLDDCIRRAENAVCQDDEAYS